VLVLGQNTGHGDMSIESNMNADALMRDASALAVSQLKWKDYR